MAKLSIRERPGYVPFEKPERSFRKAELCVLQDTVLRPEKSFGDAELCVSQDLNSPIH